MDHLEKSIISTLLYYHFLDRPLTCVELFKLLKADESVHDLSFGNFVAKLKNSDILRSVLNQFRGFYFFKEANPLSFFTLRQKRAKISHLKWKRVKKIAKVLQAVPFLEMVGVTGSLSIDNAKPESDLDLLIILKPGRLWLSRLTATAFLTIFRWRRHHEKTKDRVCLNCYLANSSFAITSEIKPHDFHSAQEYGRLIPLWEAKKSYFVNFQKANLWIKNLLINYPWTNSPNFKTISSNALACSIRKIFEYLLSGSLGNYLENKLGRWQTKRIESKIRNGEPADQIYFSDDCLMFHPHSKSLQLLAQHDAKLKELLASIDP